MDRATILTLDYGRIELGVVMCSSNWDELVDLLRDPLTYMRDEQKSNFQYLSSTGNKPDWLAKAPITAILECGYPDSRTIGRFAQMMDVRLPAVRALAKVRPTARTRKIFQKRLVKQFRKVFDKGAFQAEFSVNTRTLFIRYFQPLKLLPATRYTQEFSKSTVSATVGIFDDTLASTHFDLVSATGGKVTAEDRAKFTVAYLENPLAVCAKLNSKIAVDPLQLCDAPMYKRGATDLEIKKTVDYPAMSFTTRSRDPKTDPWPTLVVEGLSEFPDVKTPIEPCTNFVTTISQTDLYLDGGLIKSY